jgi:hypothetical protein
MIQQLARCSLADTPSARNHVASDNKGRCRIRTAPFSTVSMR